MLEFVPTNNGMVKNHIKFSVNLFDHVTLDQSLVVFGETFTLVS